MAIVDSGALALSAIQAEFGGSHPISLSEYYRNGGAVPSNNTNVATSGAINVGSFYSAVNEIGVTVSSGASTYNEKTAAFSSYWTTAVPKRLTINSGVTLGHLTIPASMAGTLIIDHSGAVQGLGGNSNGAAGSTAMTIQSTGVTINMASGSTISGGGGAGGNGGTGGQGSASANSCSCGGSPSPCNPGGWYGGGCCQENDNGCANFILCCYNNNYYSGGAGGAFGRGQGYNQSRTDGGGGSSGGTNAGTGGSGGNAGAFGIAGNNGATGANGNSTNGSAGSNGGASGRAITFSGVSAYTIIGTASGTIHGAYT